MSSKNERVVESFERQLSHDLYILMCKIRWKLRYLVFLDFLSSYVSFTEQTNES